MRVTCSVEETEVENENEQSIPGVVVTCSRCGNETKSFGTSDRSIDRCLALLREECPKKEKNFYVDERKVKKDEEGDEDDDGRSRCIRCGCKLDAEEEESGRDECFGCFCERQR
jgi:hypothetical protein